MEFCYTGLWDVSDYGGTPIYASGKPGEIFISKKDKLLLRELAAKVAELAARPLEKEKRNLWVNHNSLKSFQPVIFADPENGWNEIITSEMIQCYGKLARRWEMILRKEIYWAQSICDDKVIEPYFNVGYSYSEGDWGVPIMQDRSKVEDGGSFIFRTVIKDLKDIKKIHFPGLFIDFKNTQKTVELAEMTFGDLLKVRLKNRWWWSLGLTLWFTALRGLENMYLDFIDNPELTKNLLNIISTGIMERLDFLENNGFLFLNNDDSYVGSGGFGYTEELPTDSFDGIKVRTQDMWGFAESQETLNVSPKMFEEFVFKYQIPILGQFGLNCYGCCEPLEPIWNIIKYIPNLRRISVSPWSDLKIMARLLEDKYIFSMKFPPSYISSPDIDIDFIRKKLRYALEVTGGCVLEIIMKDNHTLGNNPANLTKWVEITRDEIALNFRT